MVTIHKDGSISIYSYGFQGSFPNFTFFFNGENKPPCQFCKHRIRNSLKECSISDYCFGFEANKPYEPFQLTPLFSFLKNEGYVIIKNHDRGFVLYHPDNKPVVYVSLFEPEP